MRPIVYPRCPYCSAQYYRTAEDRLEKATATTCILIKCPRCKERYYVGKQVRYVARMKPY